ncbi:MAG: glucosaminidase domain-containing protein [Polyangiaceae bacterium]|nr:glucosaminidase domain-containing protein [Polyangiaceae bacterium]
MLTQMSPSARSRPSTKVLALGCRSGRARGVFGSTFASRASSSVLLACLLALSDGYVPSIVYVADTTTVIVADTGSTPVAYADQSARQVPVDCSVQSDPSCPRPPETAAASSPPARPSDARTNPVELVSDERVVEARRTPISGTQAAKSLERAYRRLVGRRAGPETLALLTAHWAHETNQGASMFNYNFGGIKGTGPDGSYVLERTREGSGRSERRKKHRFRAYPSATQGALDYLSLLQRLYGNALDAAALGDADAFVKNLKQGGYFSGDEQVYLSKVTAFVTAAQQWGYDALGPSGIAPLHKAVREAALGR